MQLHICHSGSTTCSSTGAKSATLLTSVWPWYVQMLKVHHFLVVMGLMPLFSDMMTVEHRSKRN
jgi:hypothetical protein